MRTAFGQTREQGIHALKVGVNLQSVVTDICTHLQIFCHGEAGEYATPFWHQRQAVVYALVRGDVVQGFAVVVNFSCRWMQQSGQRLERGGLARAVAADKRNQFAGGYGQVNAFQRLNAAVTDFQIFNFQQVHAASPPRYAAITAGLWRTSSGTPSAIFLP